MRTTTLLGYMGFVLMLTLIYSAASGSPNHPNQTGLTVSLFLIMAPVVGEAIRVLREAHDA